MRERRIFPEARYDIDPHEIPQTRQNPWGGERKENKIKKKRKKKKTMELGAEQSLDFKTIQGFIRGLELFSLLTLVTQKFKSLNLFVVLNLGIF